MGKHTKKRVYALKADSNQLVDTVRFIREVENVSFCGLDKCAREHYRANLCQAHYQQYWKIKRERGLDRIRIDRTDALRYAQPAIGRQLKASEAFCHVPNCRGVYGARGLCRSHYKQFWKLVRENV